MIKYKPEREEITPTQWKMIDFIFEHFDSDKFINYWALDVASIKGEYKSM